MAEINRKPQQQPNRQQNVPTTREPEKPKVENKPAETAAQPAGVVVSPTTPTAPVQETKVTDESEVSRLMASQANLHSMDPRVMMQFPGNEETPDNRDRSSGKDHLINDHKMRVGNKRRFLTDALCRALGSDMYVLEVDKSWAPNPLGKGGNVPIRFTREFPTKYVLFDKFDVMPDPRILEMKRKLANDNGFKYVYETPAQNLSHDFLNKLLAEQEHIKHPEQIEMEKAQAK